MAYFKKDNLGFYYELQGKGSETLVLLNGIMMNTSIWQPHVEFFGKHFQVLATDFRGQEKSDKPDGPYTFEMHAQDLLALLDHLGIKKAHFVSTSYGGMVGMHFAVHYPERVLSLTLAATTSETDALLRAKLRAWKIAARHALEDRRKSDFFRIVLPFNYSAEFLEQNGKAVEERADLLQEQPDEWFHAAQRLMDNVFTLNLTKNLSALKMPVLVVAGTLDQLLPSSCSKRIAQEIPQAKYVEIQSGHALVMEKQQEFDRVVLSFLQGQERSGEIHD